MKTGCIGLCGGVNTAQKHMKTENPIGFCVLVLGRSIGLWQCEWIVSGPRVVDRPKYKFSTGMQKEFML